MNIEDPLGSDLDNKEKESKEKLKLKAIVADDEEDLREMTVQLLEMAGFEVAAVGDGQAAMDILNVPTQKYDLAVLDNSMPKKKGLEALREIRADDRLKNLPVIIASGDTGGETEENTKAAGGVYIYKPFDMASFVDLVKGLTKKG